MSKGTLVTVEGIDSSGKTTLVNGLEEELTDIVTTQEPSELDTGKQLRSYLQDNTTHPLQDFYAFLADRVNHIQQIIKPAMEKGRLVVSDRYSDSTRAYQPLMLNDILDFPVSYIDSTMKPWELEPDLTLFLDVSVDTALARMDGERDKYETRETLDEVRKNYEGLIATNQDRFVRIDGEQTKGEVLQDAINAIRQQTS